MNDHYDNIEQVIFQHKNVGVDFKGLDNINCIFFYHKGTKVLFGLSLCLCAFVEQYVQIILSRYLHIAYILA